MRNYKKQIKQGYEIWRAINHRFEYVQKYYGEAEAENDLYLKDLEQTLNEIDPFFFENLEALDYFHA